MFELESAGDMSVEDNRAAALHAFDQCVTQKDHADWAMKYGRHLASADCDDPDLQGQLDEAEDDANAAEAKAGNLEHAIETAIDQLDRIDPDEMSSKVMREAIDKVVVALEKATKA